MPLSLPEFGIFCKRSSLCFVALCALTLLGVWLAPESLHGSATWFPVSVHTILEVFAITVAVLVFAVTWHGYRTDQPSNLLALGCAFLAIGLLDLAHALSYKGMPDFITPASPEKAINFWLVSRLLLAIALLGAAFMPWKPMVGRPPRLLMLGSTLGLVATVGYLGLAYPTHWPRTFIEGVGLTAFKVTAEWVTIVLLGIAAVGFWRASRHRPSFDARGLLAASLLSVLAGLCFTRYLNVNGLYSLLGHLFKLFAYVFIYRAVFVTSIRAPYERLAVEMAERVAAEKRIEMMSFYDGLTELPNLALLEDRTRQALSSATRNQLHVALLFLDVDRFKMINDSLGHSYGDRLLCDLANLLCEVSPPEATVCRARGDEFVILLPDLAEPEEAAAVPERICERLRARPFLLGDQDLSITTSIGLAVFPFDGTNFETLLGNAETAMYTAKRSGQPMWRYYDPTMNAEVGEKLQLINGLRHALERDELELYYQLQFDMPTGRVIGAEALLRWQHPVWGMVPPGRFIGLAEESGLIVPIGAWILQQACRQAAAWRAQGMDIPVVAVNISAFQLHDPSLPSAVAKALEAAFLPPEALELELTESGLIQDSRQVQTTLDHLKSLGVCLSIDDFGTGYSCLAYLRRLAVHRLKIDQSFVRTLTSAQDDGVIVGAIIQMAQSLGLDVIAEGVEDEATASALCQLGCRHAQGYFYAHPVPAGALPAMLARARATAAL